MHVFPDLFWRSTCKLPVDPSICLLFPWQVASTDGKSRLVVRTVKSISPTNDQKRNE